ncbi:MAG TPA: prepilin-type N-terminal cleavage/methylation domain-containing protein [Hyphomicrobiaceae bacterium]|jgi:prepilin-type N-terminal cleavage/methylation domain-containing protein|nr:prepilin-type N-terminal cleavage/methylation domain-containing protein [Hyphomicrobiaceae bacterium]
MIKRAASRQPASEHGFSLMEMLVSLVILALILALLPGAFRLARQVWSATAMLDRDSGRDAGLDFLETRLAEAMPLFEPGKAGLVKILFAGSKDGVSFVAPSRNGPAGGGIYRYSIELRPREGAPSLLVAQVAPYFGPLAQGAAAPPAEEQVLADGVASAEFRYFGHHELRQASSWRGEWKRTDALPDLVELNITRHRAGGMTTRSIVTELRLRNAS